MTRLAPTASIFPFPVVGRCRNRQGTDSSSWKWSETPDLPLEFPSNISWFHRYKYFWFWRPHCHFRLWVVIGIVGCPSMSHIGVDTFFDIDVVDNFAFAARITVIIIYF